MKGIYSFVLVFIFSVCLLFLIHVSGAVREKLAEGSRIAMEIERASFLRFQLEENTDSIIEETIEREILAGNRNGKTLNEKISETLEAYFESIEHETGLGAKIEFFEVNTGNLSKQFTPTTDKLKKIKKLKEYCKTIVVNAGESVYIVHFYFTGGLLKNKAILGRIRTEKTEQYFLLLPGYSIGRTVVA